MLALAILLMALAPAAAQRSPFGAPDRNAPSAAEQTAETEPGVIGRLSIAIQRQQQIFYRKFSGAVRALKSGYSFEAGFGLITIAFLYGIFHAAGPGHGKAVISAYVLANERSVRRGVILAAIASLAQAVTAIVAVYSLLWAAGATGSLVRSATANLELLSFALIALLGIFMLVRAIRPVFAASAASADGHDHGHHHDHDHEHMGPDANCQTCGHAHIPAPALVDRPLTLRTALPIIASIGLRPCTGAVVVLVFAHSLGLHLAGIGAAFAMSAGTAITVATLAVFAVGARELAAKFFDGNASRLMTFYRTVSIAGALGVTLLGVILLHGALTAPTRAFL